MALTDKLTAIANAIRSKTGKEDKLTLEQMATEIDGLEIGNTETEDGLVARTVTDYINNRVTTVGTHIFMGSTALKTARFPNATNLIGTNHFYGCHNLEEVYFPKLVGGFGDSNSLYGCAALKELILPSYENSITGLTQCISLTKVDLNACTAIAQNTFFKCNSLNTVIIRNGFTSLYNINAFADTPIEAGTGYIYVPKALIEQYKVATNWINFSEQFRAIEDYPEICGGAGND